MKSGDYRVQERKGYQRGREEREGETRKESMKETKEYKAGYDCEMHGANVINCNFRLFATPEKTKDWEQGKIDGEKEMDKIKEK